MKKSALALAVIIFLAGLSFAAAPPDDSEFRSGLKSYNQKNYKASAAKFRAYVNKRPDATAYYLLGYSLYKLGKFSEADEFFDEAFLIDPEFSLEKVGLLKKSSGEIIKNAPEQTTSAPVEGAKAAGDTAAAKKPAETGKASAAKTVDTKKTAAPETTAAGAKAPEPQARATQPAPVPPAAAKPAAPAPAAKTPDKKPEPQAAAKPAQPAGTAQPSATATQQPATTATQPAAPAGPAPFVKQPMGNKKINTAIPAVGLGLLMGSIAALGMLFLAIGIGVYVFAGLCLFLIAKKLDVPAPWTAWIPLVNLWTLVTAAGKPAWWIILCFIPVINIFVFVYLYMCITENLGKNKWLGLLVLLPVIQLGFLGWLAFSKTETFAQKETAPTDMPADEEHPDEHPLE